VLALLPLCVHARVGLGLAGIILGSFGGWLQLNATRRSAAALVVAQDAFAICRALASTTWGRSYLTLFWASQIAIGVAAIATQGGLFPFAALCGYTAFAVAREVITLTASRELASSVAR
jgi:hypothetical protein